jgi:hypothetical protein
MSELLAGSSPKAAQRAVITPSYRPDAELLPELHRSVLELTPENTVHHAFVPGRVKDFFTAHEGPRCRVWTHSELLPWHCLRVPRSNLYPNARRPWPPFAGGSCDRPSRSPPRRGWIPRWSCSPIPMSCSSSRFARTDSSPTEQMCLYREEKGVTADLERHVI